MTPVTTTGTPLDDEDGRVDGYEAGANSNTTSLSNSSTQNPSINQEVTIQYNTIKEPQEGKE